MQLNAGEWRTATSAVLEFECTLDDRQINGVDIIEWGDDGRISKFKVMIWPFKAVTKVIERMRAELG